MPRLSNSNYACCTSAVDQAGRRFGRRDPYTGRSAADPRREGCSKRRSRSRRIDMGLGHQRRPGHGEAFSRLIADDDQPIFYQRTVFLHMTHSVRGIHEHRDPAMSLRCNDKSVDQR